MEEFINRFKNDNKFRAIVKLSLYLCFVVLVTIYAISISHNGSYYEEETNNSEENNKVEEINQDIIKIPEVFSKKITINLNDEEEYKYLINSINGNEEITKEVNDTITYYKKENNIYFINVDNNYLKTTTSEVYDLIDYNYLNLENINLYLSNATHSNHEYLVYIKDIILNNQTDDYFVILINDNHISIDYTPLMKEIDSEIQKCQVDIIIEESNERGE